jgi:hypothetical protein
MYLRSDRYVYCLGAGGGDGETPESLQARPGRGTSPEKSARRDGQVQPAGGKR